MQLGMVGLGRRGANLTRRLKRDGHEVVVFDVNVGTITVCSAGTGLGEAFLGRCGRGRRVFPSEGDADFAPRNEFEIELLRFVARGNEHVSYERVCSGIGLKLARRSPQPPEPYRTEGTT